MKKNNNVLKSCFAKCVKEARCCTKSHAVICRNHNSCEKIILTKDRKNKFSFIGLRVTQEIIHSLLHSFQTHVYLLLHFSEKVIIFQGLNENCVRMEK